MAQVVDCFNAEGALSTEDGAKNLIFRSIFPKQDGRTMGVTFNDVLPGGNSKRHSHAEEHVTFILEGHGVLELAGGESLELKPGSAVYIPPHEPHCFVNNGTEKLVMFGLMGPA